MSASSSSSQAIDGAPVRLMAIFGSGRSGSTWLGAILSSHPEVVYRFEPFHRLKAFDHRTSAGLGRLRSDDFSEDDLPDIYRALLPAHPESDKPPFFRKDHGVRARRGRSVLWPLSRRSSLIASTYQWLYSPIGNPPLIFKEVELTREFVKLATRTTMRMVYLVRHPCSVVWSISRGADIGVMSFNRQEVLQQSLRSHDADLADRFAPRMDELDVLQKQALLWRIDVEKVLKAVRSLDHVKIVLYEQLATNPVMVSEDILHHFQLSMSQQTRRFLEQSTQSKQVSLLKRGEMGVNRYFSVFRDPRESRDGWKRGMPVGDIDRVMDVVCDSEAFEFGLKSGTWS